MAEYTLVETVSTRIPSFPRRIRGGAEWAELSKAALPWERCGDRDFGDSVTDHATSWVRRVVTPTGMVYAKTYDYPTWAARWRGALRYTGPGRLSRAVREFDALTWYRSHQLGAAVPIAAFEQRRLGFVVRALLLTSACPGTRLDDLLPTASPDERRAIAAALGSYVATLHAAGARDGNLDLRNLIAERTAAGGYRFAKIDSPRFAVRAPGRVEDAAVRRDWQRLLPQLAAFGLAEAALAAARAT